MTRVCYKLTVCYEGTRYVGWQVQPNGPSIQQLLEQAWSAVTGEAPRIVGSGRTDAGVHALGQVCSVQTATALDAPTLQRALNAHLPEDIVVLEVVPARADFHAIADAQSKTYRYHLQFGWPRDPFQRHTSWQLKHDLNVQAMREAAALLVGEHDFASFQAAGSSIKSTVRTVSRIELFSKRILLAGAGQGGPNPELPATGARDTQPTASSPSPSTVAKSTSSKSTSAKGTWHPFGNRSHCQRLPLQHGPQYRRDAGAGGCWQAPSGVGRPGVGGSRPKPGGPDGTAAGVVSGRSPLS